jgi:hypothetical protein
MQAVCRRGRVARSRGSKIGFALVLFFLLWTSALSSEADDASVLDKIHKRLTSPEKLTYHNPIVFVGEISKMGPVYQGICKQEVNQDVDFTVFRLLFGNYHDSLVHTGYINCTTRPLPSPPFTLHVRVIVYCERFHHSVHCLDPIEYSDEHLKKVESWIAAALTLSPSAQAPDSSSKTGMMRQLSDVKFPSGDGPECLQFVLEAGDLKTEPSTAIMKAAPSASSLPTTTLRKSS